MGVAKKESTTAVRAKKFLRGFQKTRRKKLGEITDTFVAYPVGSLVDIAAPFFQHLFGGGKSIVAQVLQRGAPMHESKRGMELTATQTDGTA